MDWAERYFVGMAVVGIISLCTAFTAWWITAG